MDVTHGNHYSPALVVLSVVLAIISSYFSFDLSHRACSALNKKNRTLYLALSSSTLGLGIWTMHFLGLPNLSVPVNIVLTLISAILPVISSFIAFSLAVSMRTNRFIFAGICMGAGISGMHYIGMEAISSSLLIRYDTFFFILSILIAVGVSFIALFRMFQNQREPVGRRFKFVNASLLGIAISGMHYTGMSATHFLLPVSALTTEPPPYPLTWYIMGPGNLIYGICAALALLGGFVYFGVAIERKLSQEDAGLNAYYYRSLFEHNPDLVFSLDLEGNIVSVNEAALRATGYSREELLRQRSASFLVQGEEEKYKRGIDKVKSGIPQNFEIKARHKQGKAMEFSVTAIPIIKWKKIIGVYCIGKDITEQKQNEEILRRTDKLAMAGQLAAGIAHEIRNPLTTVRGMTQLIQRGDGKEGYYDIILDDLDQIESILSEFLMMAAPCPNDYQYCNLQEIIQSTVQVMKAEAELKGIRLLTEFVASPTLVKCDEVKIRHVFAHLLRNAIDSMNHGGDIRLGTGLTEHNKVLVRICDQGLGIPEEWRGRMGEPHYSTKEKGTGLGLMVSYKIIQEHNGNIVFYRGETSGTVVEVTLPTVPAPAPDKESGSQAS